MVSAPPVVRVPAVVLDDDVAAAPAHRLLDLDGGPGPEPSSAVRFAYTKDAFLAQFEIATEPPILVARASGEEVFRDECAELFLASPDEPARYQELVANAAGALYVARVFNPGESRESWELRPGECLPGVAVAASGGPGPDRRLWTRWTCRFRVPWSAWPSSRTPAAGEERRANATRTARGRTTRYAALAPTLRTDPPDFHVPSRFARLVFGAPGAC